jgi:hypothetical protein
MLTDAGHGVPEREQPRNGREWLLAGPVGILDKSSVIEQPQTGPLLLRSHGRCHRTNVLVHTEQVRRIVLALDHQQASVVIAE